MADIFQLGQEGKASVFIKALKALRDSGSQVLDTLEKARLDSLVEFDRRLQAINSRRVRSWRVPSKEQALKFVVSDFSDIDQSNTTGTVRADSSSITLRERAIPAQAVIKSNRFTSNKGTIEALDSSQTILRVHTDDFSIPTGQFDIELVTSLNLSQFIFDIIASPSQPNIEVTVSLDGLTYISAKQSSINGYRINTWLTPSVIRFIRIRVTPSHSDDLNGNTFTFGVTHFSAQSTSYHLRSEFVTKTLQFSPKSELVVLNAPVDSRIQYYLSVFADGDVQAPFVEVNPGDAINIGTKVISTITTAGSSPNLLTVAPLDLYLRTVNVTENGNELRIAPGLPPTGITNLQHEYVSIVLGSIGYNIELLRANGNYNPPRTFVVSYIYGPPIVKAKLKVRLSTDDSTVSPIFRGASLDEE